MRNTVICSVVIALIWILTISTGFFVFPNFKHAMLITHDERKEITWPFKVKNTETSFPATLVIDVPYRSPRKYILRSDIEILAVRSNALPVTFHRKFIGEYNYGYTFATNKPADSGENRIEIVLGSNGYDFRIDVIPSFVDVVIAGWYLLLVILFATSLWLLGTHTSFFNSRKVAGIIVIGILVRILYFVVTPFDLRSHDLQGHIEYIQYFAENLSIPPANFGWETHQPPLYYILAGLWMKLTGQVASSWLYNQWQALSLLLSFGSLLLCVKISEILFRNAPRLQHLFIWLTSLFPGFVYYSARIGNDTLFGSVSFVWIWLLLKWWRKRNLSNWWPLAIVVAITFITKNEAIVLMAITLGILAISGKTRLKEKLMHSLALLACLLVVAGWYQIPKALNSRTVSAFVVGGGVYSLNKNLRVQGTLGDCTTFNPVQVMVLPFNNPWDDSCRRQYFPEFYFKSSLFGEWRWDHRLTLSARGLVLTALLLLFIGITGIFRCCYIKDGFLVPLGLTMIVILLAQVVLVLRHPYACSQDFRYFIITAVPFFYFIAKCVYKEILAAYAIGLFAITSLTFFLHLPFMLI
jgi:hypothetical protein